MIPESGAQYLRNFQIPEGISWAKCSKETPYGTISVSWKLENESFKMNVKIPVNCTATVKLPEVISGLKVNGRRIKTDIGSVEIGSGSYEIISIVD